LAVSTATPGTKVVAPTATLRAASNAACVGVVNVGSANVRRGDSQAFDVIRALPESTQVEVLGLSSAGSGWFKVRLDDGAEAWMAPFVLTVDCDLDDLPRLTPPAVPPSAPTSAPNVPATVAPGSNAVCGNGWCEGDEAATCCTDCGNCAPTGPYCGDGICNGNESALIVDGAIYCPSDCHPALPPTPFIFRPTPIITMPPIIPVPPIGP
jgi:hypothetical protein